ncbi:hypothetical protein PHYPSEUDO_013894 [Phytophthora pseudosyringae]|uniref:Helicase-associated domain-containing protein n=1 Tax=Phytophthora pseudosyringae TaxID=221518 RepID=A0A8T1W681_9STRA|nr:hypothetical protein PHYPSEUDO_013894 [Phytophthora pseudosyringae]
MLRAFLGARAGLVRRPHAAPGGTLGIIRCAGVSSSTPTWRGVRINLYSAHDWVKTIAPCLQTFQTLEEHLLVPLKFSVPYGDPKWPEQTWGYPLGLYCKNLRALKQQGKNLPFFAVDDLETLNFPWDMRQYKWDVLVLPALTRYAELNGHCDIPSAFVIPTGDDAWPKLLWNFKLGQTVTSIRCAGTYKAQRESSHDDLEKIDFSMQGWRARMWEIKILPALEAFRRVFGHCNVNFNYVVPDSDEWPKATRGLRLGATVANMRCRSNYDDMTARDKDKLEAIGFIWSPENERWTYRIMPALETFREVYRSGWVPVDFVVPDEEPWPEASRGLRLGNTFMKIRHAHAYSSYVERDRERLNELGIEFKVHFSSIPAPKAAY